MTNTPISKSRLLFNTECYEPKETDPAAAAQIKADDNTEAEYDTISGIKVDGQP